MLYLLDTWVYFFAWNVFNCTWFWSVLDCTFLLKDYMAMLASVKSAMADLWSWKKGFKSLKTPGLCVKLEFWESYKQARNLLALTWRNLHLPLSEKFVLGWRSLSRRSSTAFFRKPKSERQRWHDIHSLGQQNAGHGDKHIPLSMGSNLKKCRDTNPTGRPYSNARVPRRKAFTLHISWLGEQQLLCVFGTIFYFSFYWNKQTSISKYSQLHS